MDELSTENRITTVLYKLVDYRQPEVKWAIGFSVVTEAIFVILSLHASFLIYENVVLSLVQCIIASLISFIGIAIAGIAIVIALFTSAQIKTINKLIKNSFDRLLFDFKWFALLSTIEAIIFSMLIFIIRSPFSLAPAFVFYAFALFLVYGIYYLLFYGCSLVGNFIKMSRLKCSLDTATSYSKSICETSTEIQLDYLMTKILEQDETKATRYYTGLIEVIQNSTLENKEEVVSYLEKRYNISGKVKNDCPDDKKDTNE